MSTQTVPAPAHANGTEPTEPETPFPLDSFKDAAKHLRRPFTPAAVKFKVQATWPKEGPTGGLIVAYIDARLAVERLNLIVPHLWSDAYEPTGKDLLCRLTVDGISRFDVGQGVVKGLYSDALKRAAVKFGVGVSLYAIPKMMLDVQAGHLKPKRSRDGATLELTPAGERHVRSLYARWLAEHGSKAFGEPLDHGDSEDAQGDAEVDVETPPVAAPPAAPPTATREDVQEITAASKGLTAQQIKLALGSCGIPDVEFYEEVPKSKVVALVQALAGMDRKPVEASA